MCFRVLRPWIVLENSLTTWQTLSIGLASSISGDAWHDLAFGVGALTEELSDAKNLSIRLPRPRVVELQEAKILHGQLKVKETSHS